MKLTLVGFIYSMKLGNKHFERFNITTDLEFLEFICNQWSNHSCTHHCCGPDPNVNGQNVKIQFRNCFSLICIEIEWMCNVQCSLFWLTISAFTIHKLILIRNFELFIMLESRWLYDSSTQRSLNRKSKGIIWIIFDCHHSMEMLPVEWDQYCAYHNAINVITNKSKALFAPNIAHYEKINCQNTHWIDQHLEIFQIEPGNEIDGDRFFIQHQWNKNHQIQIDKPFAHFEFVKKK